MGTSGFHLASADASFNSRADSIFQKLSSGGLSHAAASVAPPKHLFNPKKYALAFFIAGLDIFDHVTHQPCDRADSMRYISEFDLRFSFCMFPTRYAHYTITDDDAGPDNDAANRRIALDFMSELKTRKAAQETPAPANQDSDVCLWEKKCALRKGVLRRISMPCCARARL